MTEECSDYIGYKKGSSKPDYIVECGEIIWLAEEEMRKGVKCYDEAHSKARCITDKYKDKLEKELDDFAYGARKPLCKDIEMNVFTCIQKKNNITACEREILYFNECVQKTIEEIYDKHCDKHKSPL